VSGAIPLLHGNALDRRRTAMTRRLLRLAVTAALFVVPVSAFAQTGTVVDWGPDCYAYESNYNPATYISAAGSSLNIVGVVNGFLGPLGSIDPNGGTEYTLYMTGMTSAGTVITPGVFANTYRTVYNGGSFQIWEDTPRDAAFGTNPPNATVPSSFTDGSLFLSGFYTSLTVTFSKQNSNQQILGGNADTGEPSVANGVFTGGSALPLVSIGGRGCPFRITGGWLAKPGNFPTGYTAHFDGKIDINCPTETTPSTWGKIKSQYRD